LPLLCEAVEERVLILEVAGVVGTLTIPSPEPGSRMDGTDKGVEHTPEGDNDGIRHFERCKALDVESSAVWEAALSLSDKDERAEDVSDRCPSCCLRDKSLEIDVENGFDVEDPKEEGRKSREERAFSIAVSPATTFATLLFLTPGVTG
jgi:hypothetical protein